MLRVLALAVLICLVSAQQNFPGKNWVRHTPEQEGIDSAKLKEAFDYAFQPLTDTYCVSIHRNGYLIADKYGIGQSYNKTNIIWSVSKAFTATLIGTLERDNKLKTTDLMTKYVPEWNKPQTKNITMEEVMRHCSGRYYDPVTDFATPQTLGDQTEFAISLPQEFPPGTHDQYNQMAYQTLQQVYESTSGIGMQAGAQKELYGPLQFESQSYWQTEGFFTGVPQKHPLVYGGMTTSCPDLGRFGWLWLNAGNWSGKPVFTRDFWNKALSQPDYPFGKARRYGNWGAGPSVKSEGLGNQIVVFNVANNIVMTRVGSFATVGFKPGDFIAKVVASIKNPKLRGNLDDWFIAGI